MRAFVLLLAFCTLTACRDAQDPWSATEEPTDTTTIIHLTLSAGTDAQPGWSVDGEAIYYAGESFPGLPPGRGLMLAMWRHGGAASLLLPEVQGAGAGGPRWLAVPASSPAGDRIAYIEMAAVAQPGRMLPPEPCVFAEPLLDSLVLRVRARAATGPILNDPALPLRLEGRDPGQRAGLPGPFDLRLFPFQRLFAEDGWLALRPSWAPDGNRIVLSDGLRLLVWTIGGGAVEIEGTDDGVSPAWSPDGEWIAFTRMTRADSTVTSCTVSQGNTAVVHNRTGYVEAPPVIVLVTPDGGTTREIGIGEEPAWSPDSRTLYFVRNGQIWRVSIDGGSAEAIPGTEFGRSPAISPDGGRVVFARLETGSNFDLWSAPLPR